MTTVQIIILFYLGFASLFFMLLVKVVSFRKKLGSLVTSPSDSIFWSMAWPFMLMVLFWDLMVAFADFLWKDR